MAGVIAIADIRIVAMLMYYIIRIGMWQDVCPNRVRVTADYNVYMSLFASHNVDYEC